MQNNRLKIFCINPLQNLQPALLQEQAVVSEDIILHFPGTGLKNAEIILWRETNVVCARFHVMMVIVKLKLLFEFYVRDYSASISWCIFTKLCMLVLPFSSSQPGKVVCMSFCSCDYTLRIPSQVKLETPIESKLCGKTCHNLKWTSRLSWIDE